ncbi:ParM/StbA family protein [Cyanobacteria bacterium FACHB-63]|nr:ParM/StbA family protein [Cyanobacteria bacterium FACHB-63]
MLLASIDLGSSLTKSFYLNGGMPCPLLMPPEIAWVQPELLGKYQSVNAEAQPDKVAWVQLGDEIAAVGQFAQGFAGDQGLVERKQRRAIYKLLAVLGVVREKLDLPTTTTASLSLMLPVTEFSDRKTLQTTLQEAAQNFNFRGRSLSISFNKLQILPEGFGLFLTRRAELLKQGINAKSRMIIVLMFGHRNLSILVFQDGVLQGSSRSDGPGFFQAVEIVASLKGLSTATPGLTEAIATNQPRLRVAGQLIPLDLTDAIASAREGYCRQVKSYLENHLPGDQYDVIVAGGASAVIHPELNELFQVMGLGDRVSFGEGLQHQLAGLLRDDSTLAEQPSLLTRMADIYAVFGATWAMHRQQSAA